MEFPGAAEGVLPNCAISCGMALASVPAALRYSLPWENPATVVLGTAHDTSGGEAPDSPSDAAGGGVDEGGVRRFVDPKRVLRPHQYRQMSTQPDLVLAYAHHLADEARGEGDVAVYADAWVTWNGRRSQPFVRPDVDLARVPDTLASARRYVPEPRDPQVWSLGDR